ncbi:hypothetical protein H2200_003030 [Cladophialophora chaetospira]|uniref:Peptidase A1 domain-containing protein n=1 Tax=Cladophialophora chaetospira TaxID=386627 RepID=A0AA38XHF6_9EURO|nr:hypothetical protein H2200_003030 [Cladophialophora chaetospira]
MKPVITAITASSLVTASFAANPNALIPLFQRERLSHSTEREQIRKRVHPRQIGQILDPLKSGGSFVAQVSLGTENFDLTLDTGSGDVWVVGSNVTCLGGDCNWGNTYDEQSGNFQADGGTWSISYGSGGNTNTDSGYTGTADVTLAGLTVTSQHIGVADKVTDPNFMGSISGILGMGVASSTGFAPIMQTFIDQGVVDQPYFSLILSRDASASGTGGYITLGSLPALQDPRVNASSSYVTGPWEAAGGVDHPGYTTTFSSIQAGSSGSGINTYAGVQYTIDNGNPGLDFPTATADAIAALFDPPAQKSGSGYTVDCDATAPYLAFDIGGSVLPINPEDLITGSGSQCSTPIFDNGNDNMGLGSPFLKNVLCVFDWGNQQLGFYSRPYYQS